jgi:hypothetical protein
MDVARARQAKHPRSGCRLRQDSRATIDAPRQPTRSVPGRHGVAVTAHWQTLIRRGAQREGCRGPRRLAAFGLSKAWRQPMPLEVRGRLQIIRRKQGCDDPGCSPKIQTPVSSFDRHRVRAATTARSLRRPTCSPAKRSRNGLSEAEAKSDDHAAALLRQIFATCPSDLFFVYEHTGYSLSIFNSQLMYIEPS